MSLQFKILIPQPITKKEEVIFESIDNALKQCSLSSLSIDQISSSASSSAVAEYILNIKAFSSIPLNDKKKLYLQLNRIWDAIKEHHGNSLNVPLLKLHHNAFFESFRYTEHGDVTLTSLSFGILPISTRYISYKTLCGPVANFYHDISTLEIIVEWDYDILEFQYKLVIQYKFIRRILLHVTEVGVKIYLDLLHVPILCWAESKRNKFGEWYELNHRTRELPHVEASVIGKANVLLLKFSDFQTGFDIVSRLHFRCGKMDILYGCIENCDRDLPAEPNFSFSSFSCNYLKTAITTRSFFLAEQLRMNLYPTDNLLLQESQDLQSLEKALTEILFLIDTGKFFIFWQALPLLVAHFQKKDENSFEHYIVPEKSRLIRRVVITPTRTLFYAPEVMLENRVLRNFDSDYALRVNFRDDDFSRLSFLAAYAEAEIFVHGVKAPMINGIVIAQRHYEFLAWSNSQIRDHGVWMYARDLKYKTASDIRRWMGDFSHIKSVSKYMARMGQCFSQTVESVSVPLDGNRVKVEKDIERGLDCSNKPYCFSDGIGKISVSLAKEVRDALGYNKHCSAFQIRYGGCKGMLVVDPTLNDADIVFRDSMKKFDSPQNTCLEIAKTSAPSSLQLNRPFITILSQLGVDVTVFLRLQEDMLCQLTNMLLQEDKAAEYLTSKTPLDCLKFKELSASGMALTTEPFFRSLLLVLHRHHVGKIKSRANIAIDPSKGRDMLSVLDETGILEYGQVFVQYTNDILSGETTKDTTIITGTVLVTKNPCVHPGDVRKFEAVDVVALHHIVDCIVFPQKGHRPHPNEMAGSDLDGDECAVIWQKDLIFPGPNKEPGDFRSRSPPTHDRITIENMIDFLVEYIKNDLVGSIATAHLALADSYGISHPKCIDLANKFSVAVDFAKNGVKARLTAPERADKFPDFMERNYKKTYKARGALGKLFRICKDFETENTNAIFKYGKQQVDPFLVYPGWEKYEEEAIGSRDKYNRLLGSIFQNYGIPEEAEAFSGAFSRLHCRFQERKDKAEVEKVILGSLKALCKNIKNEFFSEFEGNVNTICTSIYQKASAWYVVTYREENPKFLSFPWIISTVLANVYLRNRPHTTKLFNCPIAQKIDIAIQETASANLLNILPDEASHVLLEYDFTCEAKVVERALRVMMHWAVDREILKDFHSTKERGFLYKSTFIKLFLHVASLEKYVTKKSSNKKPKIDGFKSSADLCLAFLRFCVSFRFRNKQAMKDLVPFEIYKYKKLSNLAMTSYQGLATSGHFDVLCFDSDSQEDIVEMKVEYMDKDVFPCTPIPDQHLKRAAKMLAEQSGVQSVGLREQRTTKKVIVSAEGRPTAISTLRQLIRKDPQTLKSLFQAL